jgi:hypothetical protein
LKHRKSARPLLALALAFASSASGVAATDGGAPAVPTPAAAAASQPASRFACLETTNGGDLRVELAHGDGDASWQGYLQILFGNGDAELSGALYDVGRLKPKQKQPPPQLRLKVKALTDAQRAALLQGLAAAVNRPDEELECLSPLEATATLTWSCARQNARNVGNLAYKSTACVPKAKAYTRATGIADWAVAVLKRHGGR